MATSKYGFQGSMKGLNAPANWGENWGSNASNPAFTGAYSAGQGINPYALDFAPQSPPQTDYSGFGGTAWQPSEGFSFTKRPDALSAANTPGIFGGMFDGVGSALKDSGFLGSLDTNTGIKTDGWGGAALGVANGLMSGYMGMKQYGLSKDIFENNKAQFERNFGAQKGITNASLQDRQERRVREASANGNSSATNVADYMSKYGVK